VTNQVIFLCGMGSLPFRTHTHFIKSLSLLHASSRNILYLRESADVQRLASRERNLSRESTYRHAMSEKKEL
jgi:hypothetical protein